MDNQGEMNLIHAKKHFTPLVALQIFAAGLIFTVCILSLLVMFLKSFYEWEPSNIGGLSYSPVYAVAAAGACLALSFLIPEFLLDSARRELKRETSDDQTEDLPFILVPSTFIRFSLLAVVTIIGFIMVFAGRGVSVFLPFALISLVLMVTYFPTEARMKSWLQAH
jgi:amino acid transporter